MIRWHVISAVFWRNVKQFFSSIQGYLFIVVFVTCCAVLTFSPQFFADNLATLDKLSRWYPLLLLFLVPGITMGVWADEKRQGTDAILFTLPASNVEILLGKYLSVAAVYTVALLFSGTQLIALRLIGDPDWGVVATTYLGYWLAGLALLSVGMFASSLTRSPALAFVLGDVFCAVPVAIGYYFRGVVEIERWGFDWNLSEFTVGLIPLSGVLYFVFLTLFMLYLNLIVISHRHWSGSEHISLGGQLVLRAGGLLVGLLALIVIVDVAGSFVRTQADWTSEKLFTLADTTRETLADVRKKEKQVNVQAFLSNQVPRDYVAVRKQLVGLLRQYDVAGGNNLIVDFVDVAPNSPQEIEARQLGIQPREDSSEVGGRTVTQDVFLGARISTEEGDMVLPMLDGDSSIEYELTRAVALTADKSSRKTLGIVDTDAHFGGAELDGRRYDWAHARTLARLKKEYEIKLIPQDELAAFVAPDTPEGGAAETDPKEGVAADDRKVREAPDVMIVADPSSLTTAAMDALVKYVRAGHPTLILADPLPFFFTFQNPTEIGVLNAPRQERVSMRSPYAQILSSSMAPKDDDGKAGKLLAALGIEWDNGAAVWAVDNPFPNFSGDWLKEFFGDSWPQYYGPFEKAFVWARDHAETAVFNPDSVITGGLKVVLFFYPGSIRPAADANTEFTPLITLGERSGVTPWEELTLTPKQVQPRFDRATGQLVQDETAAINRFTQADLLVLNPQPRTVMDDSRPVVAARIQSDSINVVFIADSDFATDLFYQQQEALGQPLDNIAFLENAIEVLAGESGFVSLRNRRADPRTLTRLEKWTDELRTETIEARETAERESQDALKAAQQKLDEATKKISADQSLSLQEKLQQTFSSASDAQRKYDLQKASIDRELDKTIDNLKSREQQQIRAMEERIQLTAILLAPLPALLLGIVVLTTRLVSERRHIRDERRV